MADLPRFFSSRTLAAILIGMSVFVLVAGIRTTGVLQSPEIGAYDTYLKLKAGTSAAPAPITLVTITEADIRALGSWPVSDKKLAELLKLILRESPRVIGLDIYRDIPVPPGNRELTELFDEGHPIVTVRKTGNQGQDGVAAPYMLKDQGSAGSSVGFSVGFNDLPVDKDGTIRRGLLFMEDGEAVLNSFSLLLALSYLGHDSVYAQPDTAQPDHVRIGKMTFVPFRPDDGGYIRADAGGYQMLLDFGSKQFQTVSVSSLLSGNVPPALMRDRVIIIGSVAESMKDIYAAPVAGAFSGARLMQGLEIHAQAAGQIIRAATTGRGLMRAVPEWSEWLLILIAAMAGGLCGLPGRSAWTLPAILLSGLVVLTAGTFLAFRADYWIPAVPPMISWVSSLGIITAYLSYREKNDRRLLMKIFSSHVSKDIADALWRERTRLMASGRLVPQKMTATVLFTDLQNFTATAEKQEPEELMDWLNTYMNAMADAVMRHNGTVNKFIGDAVMALFGAPVGHEDEAAVRASAKHAVRCALAMRTELEALNRKWEHTGRMPLAMRVGIHTGPLVAGSIGSRERMEYTVIGDTVNTASRLEGYLKELQGAGHEAGACGILISEATMNLLGDDFRTERIGEIKVKGREEGLTVFRVIGSKES
ncbi:MAG: adenylate/guanylate cyclase domain-containing protein [Thermodesulfovibrio sp.]|nr:adenylate/guanylate cyclase domain-containing protein [Thermodesulfovibrio sp.]